MDEKTREAIMGSVEKGILAIRTMREMAEAIPDTDECEDILRCLYMAIQCLSKYAEAAAATLHIDISHLETEAPA